MICLCIERSRRAQGSGGRGGRKALDIGIIRIRSRQIGSKSYPEGACKGKACEFHPKRYWVQMPSESEANEREDNQQPCHADKDCEWDEASEIRRGQQTLEVNRDSEAYACP